MLASNQNNANFDILAETPEPDAVERPRLSTDFLNRYAEVAMMLTLAIDEPDVLDTMQDWQPTNYVDHFIASGLRSAKAVIGAYYALPAQVRDDFDTMAENLNKLAQVSILAMTGAKDPGIRATLAEISVTSLSHHIGRLAAFLNTNGLEPLVDSHDDIQAAVDKVMAARH
jgi:hypothetical protein